jgi:signal transduction histidine kinase
MRSAFLFLIAILTPCAVLGWVSWRSMRREASDIQGQRTAFYQQSADNAARGAGEFMTAQLRTFGETVDRLLADESPDELRPRFHQTLRGAFPLAAAGLVFDSQTGRVLPQTEPSEQAVTAFVTRHAWFFRDEAQQLFVEIPVSDTSVLTRKTKFSVRGAAKPAEAASITDALNELAKDAAPPPPAAPPTSATGGSRAIDPTPTAVGVPEPFAAPKAEAAREQPAGAAEVSAGDNTRRIAPPETAAPGETGSPASVRPVTTTLGRLLARHETGMAGQPRDEGIFILFWYRPPDLPEMTFAAALEPAALKAALAAHPAFTAPDDDTCLALLDHQLQPAAQWTHGSAYQPVSWASPLVAREIGAALPRWKASVFLRDPAVFHKLASAARWQLGMIVTTASLAAIAGAFFILRDARRASRDARLKTDFVSSVSHELKTPLTSIRMFSDLLGNNPAAPPEKTKRYAEVIAGETARLTRLINNVLNFSRMEGGKHELQTAPLDLRDLTAETVEHMRPPLEKDGFTLEVVLPDNPVVIHGDSDALSQVLLNLLANAAKYGVPADGTRVITVTLTATDARAVLSVADRGPGVPRGYERRIFEKFQRAHNSLSSGTAGSGLGLTIARRLVEAHHGTLEYSPREGGGAVFTVSLAANHNANV